VRIRVKEIIDRLDRESSSEYLREKDIPTYGLSKKDREKKKLKNAIESNTVR
jgi:hypothetical protein